MEPERLIEEVQIRPGLFNKHSPEYANKKIKEALWMDVSRTLIEDWDDMSEVEKNVQCKEIQLKWKHIRDNFRRELLLQKKGNQGVRKKRKYKYFDQMLFLIPYVNDGNIAENCNTTDSNDCDLKDESQGLIEVEMDSSPSVDRPPPRNTYTRNKYASRSASKTIIRPWRKKKTTFEEQILKNLKNKDSLDTDEDRTFCLSLVSSMKKMDDATKLSAKIDILNVIRQYTVSQTNVNPIKSDQETSKQQEKTVKKTWINVE